jgi:hypothetical protein
MTGWEVWFANEKSPQMEKCPTMWKTKERAERYAARVERLGYDTVILPWDYKSPKHIGKFGGNKSLLTREHVINGKKYQMWGFDTKSKASANQYADQLRRTGKDVIVQESKTPESTSGWMIFARKRPGRRIGSFGAPMPKSTEICKYCKHFYTHNLPGGWCESGCTKYGWKPDGQGGSGLHLGQSYQKCQGNGFEYVQRVKRLVPVPKPDWVK